MRLIAALLAVIIFSVGLVGCEIDTANHVQEGNGASDAISESEGSESDALAGINLEDYTAMPQVKSGLFSETARLTSLRTAVRTTAARDTPTGWITF